MSWTSHRVVIAVPATERGMARFLWRFLDPDRGGEQTFDKPNWTRNGEPWLVCCTQLESDLWPALQDAQRAKDIEAKLKTRERRLRQSEILPDRIAIANLRQRMFVRRVPDGTNPRQVLESAGFVEVPRDAAP